MVGREDTQDGRSKGPDSLRALGKQAWMGKRHPDPRAEILAAADAWERQIENMQDNFETAVGRALDRTPAGRAYLAKNKARIEELEGAIRFVLDDEESGHWGPDVTMVAVLRAALAGRRTDDPHTG